MTTPDFFVRMCAFITFTRRSLKLRTHPIGIAATQNGLSTHHAQETRYGSDEFEPAKKTERNQDANATARLRSAAHIPPLEHFRSDSVRYWREKLGQRIVTIINQFEDCMSLFVFLPPV